MKAGVLTFHHAHHYGAQLQAYALMKAVLNTGADCEIINYVRSDTTEGNRLFKMGLSARSVLSNADTLMHYGRFSRRYKRFESFVNEDMKLSDKFYGSYAELKKDAPFYDAYICGSDQIWNPLIYKENTFDPAFFADFALKGKKIAYAPSFGINEIPDDKREILKEYLAKFSSLSVREQQGEKIISDVAGRESVTVLDPTLLLTGEEWGRLAAEPDIRGPYLLCYFITDGRKYSDFVKVLAERYKLPVITLCGARRVVPQTSRKVLDAGPREFLGLFRNASLVCTDSFHGTVFSINFKKEFFCFESAKKSGKSVNSRLHNILGKLGMMSRVFSVGTDVNEFRNFADKEIGPIDYAEVERALQQERDISVKYLEEALR